MSQGGVQDGRGAKGRCQMGESAFKFAISLFVSTITFSRSGATILKKRTLRLPF